MENVDFVELVLCKNLGKSANMGGILFGVKFVNGVQQRYYVDMLFIDGPSSWSRWKTAEGLRLQRFTSWAAVERYADDIVGNRYPKKSDADNFCHY